MMQTKTQCGRCQGWGRVVKQAKASDGQPGGHHEAPCPVCGPQPVRAEWPSEAEAAAVLGADTAAHEPAVVCAWCKALLKDGSLPASHGICAHCAKGWRS